MKFFLAEYKRNRLVDEGYTKVVLLKVLTSKQFDYDTLLNKVEIINFVIKYVALLCFEDGHWWAACRGSCYAG
jgi:hypothetical protein